MDATNSLKLRCFQHCRKDTDLVCFRLPERCPLCGEDTAMTPCRIPPYILPSPFVSSGAAPRSVVVRPTNGTFIRLVMQRPLMYEFAIKKIYIILAIITIIIIIIIIVVTFINESKEFVNPVLHKLCSILFHC